MEGTYRSRHSEACDEGNHYGPVAQDFFAAFGDDGVGTIGSPTTITSTDMNGVLMLVVQALG